MTAALPRPVATWQEALAATSDRLGNDTEARWLIEEVSGCRWTDLFGLERPVTDRALGRLERLVDRRLAGEPVQYVLGRWPFRTLDLMVDARVLIPRPETEQVVEFALRELDRLEQETGAREGRSPLTVVDLGTGSGAIALSVAAERPNVRVHATDASEGALAVAGANLAGLGGGAAPRVRLHHGDWWAGLPRAIRGRIDLVVANPPYIASAEVPSLDSAVREWEPRAALEPGPTGLEAIREIIDGAAAGWLRPRGCAVIEIAPHQASSATGIASAAGFADVEVMRDLAGRDRVLIARGAP